MDELRTQSDKYIYIYLYNNWNENALEGINSRLKEVKESISNLEDRVVEITPAKQHKEKDF